MQTMEFFPANEENEGKRHLWTWKALQNTLLLKNQTVPYFIEFESTPQNKIL